MNSLFVIVFIVVLVAIVWNAAKSKEELDGKDKNVK